MRSHVTARWLLAALIPMVLCQRTLRADGPTFTVNSTDDVPDGVPGDGRCETVAGNGICTLRAAVQERRAAGSGSAPLTVVLPAGTYRLTRTGAELLGASGDLNLLGNIIIRGAGASSTIIDGNGMTEPIFNIGWSSFGRTEMSDITLTNAGQGVAGGSSGGSIFRRIVVTGNTGSGVQSSYPTSIYDSTISNNGGSGVDVYWNYLYISGSAIYGNMGGGVRAQNFEVVAINSTISGNRSTGSGGGIVNNVPIRLFNVTVANNTANADGVGGETGGGLGGGGTAYLYNTILSGNLAYQTPDDCSGIVSAPDSSIITTVVTSHCTVSGSVLQVDPKIGPLADNGGPTYTHALLPSSPAIDGGFAGGCHNSGAALIASDQRGFPRPDWDSGRRCDIGAFEQTFTAATVDFDGTALGDILIYRPSTGHWSVQVAGPTVFYTAAAPGPWSPGWDATSGRFDADPRTDLFLINPQTGQWFVMGNEGPTGFSPKATGAWSTVWQRFVVDLDGDGLSDVFLWDPSSGQWFKCLWNGAEFSYVPGAWTPGWEVYPTQFNGDTLQDFFLYQRSTGQWFWAVGAAGPGFSFGGKPSGFWSTDWTITRADFSGDGNTDMLLINPLGFSFVAISTSTGFAYVPQGQFTPGFNAYALRIDTDADADLFMHNPTTGQWFEFLSDGAGAFTAAGGGTWSLGWDLIPTDFDGDGRSDLLLYNPSSGLWFRARNTAPGAFSYLSGYWSAGLSLLGARR